MSGLFGSLQMAARSLAAQQAGLDLTGQNIANLNTPGYARRRLELAEVVYGAKGVEVLGTRALRDAVLDARVRLAVPDESRERALAGALAVAETAIGAPGEGLDARFTAFFDAWAALSLDPTSAVARDAVVQQGRALSLAFHDTHAQLSESRLMADRSVRQGVAEVNALSAEIADLNRAIAAGGADVEALKSRQQVAVETLAGLTAIAVLPRGDGGVDVTIPSGRALVIGDAAYGVAVGNGPDGMATLSLGGYDITAEVTNGRIGGLLQARDTLIPGYLQQLDAMAFATVQQVNTVHQGGFDATGAAAGAFFTPLAGATGAAAAIGVSAAIAANPSLVAASATGAPGDNQTATALAALRDATVLAGGTATFAEAWGQLAYTVGSHAADAMRQFEARAAVRADVERLRDQVSGVSLDEEAANLIKFQRAYEANAKFFATIDSVLGTLMSLAGAR
ncbi:MAG: flagellar hook-associated protein FlgK [Vicinamibacterales bacterium]